jgi:flagellar biosynthesis/type III secretory pathway chaperone
MQALTGKRAELLRRLATKEAARRQELAVTNQSREDTPEDYAGPSSVTIEQLAAEEQELIQVLQEERSRNDVEWQSIRNVSTGNVSAVVLGQRDYKLRLVSQISTEAG